MKISKKQEDEIKFMIYYWNKKQNINKYIPTQEEKEEYIRQTVLWIWNKFTRKETNTLILSKRSFDIILKMWKQDLINWILDYKDLLDDFDNNMFLQKVLNNIRKNTKFELNYKDLNKFSILWYNNFR